MGRSSLFTMVLDKWVIISDLMEQPVDSINPTNPRIKNEGKNLPVIRDLGIKSIIILSVMDE